MHCAGCHAAQQSEDFSHRADHGYQAIGDFRVGLHMIPGHDLLAGVEARRLDRAEHVEELSADARPASGYDKVAVYLQDQFDLIKDRLRAVAGVRYDGKTDLFDAKTSPRLALVYTPSDRLVVRGGYSTAFRFPTFSELYQSSWFFTISTEIGIPPFPFSVFRPNPALKPEEISTWNIGGEYQISPVVSAKADLYRSKVHNFVVITQQFNPLPNPSTIGWENQSADAHITGGEFELRANFAEGVTGFANWTHQTEKGSAFEFVYSPKDKFNVGAYAGPYNNVRGTLEVAYRGGYDAPRSWFFVRSNFTDSTPHQQPGYALVNARVSYDFGRSRPIRLSIIGNNLLDKRPEETLVGGVNRLAGREVFGQLEVHF
jgi:outer membrane receptor protein involved in Fe transport